MQRSLWPGEKSRMSREAPVRFREGLGVKLPRATRLVVFCESQEDAQVVKDQILPPWLAERGLSLSEQKTRIVHLTEGFDFLSFNVKPYHAPCTTRTGHKLLIKPSKKAMTRKRQELREAWLRLRGQSVPSVLKLLNPMIRGWANYFRTVVASEVFHGMDHWMHLRTVRSVKHMHPTKSKKWRVQRYWGKLNKERDDRWVFGDKRVGGYLLKFSWFKIVRHELVRGTASPDDPSLRDYWWSRRKITMRSLSPRDVKLAAAQDWRCPVCGRDLLIEGEELHRHHKNPRSMGGSDAHSNRELGHLYCHQQRHAMLRRKRQQAALDIGLIGW
jgi:RNA-directed DNA polymerase